MTNFIEKEVEYITISTADKVKICNKCARLLCKESFYKGRAICKDCYREYQREYKERKRKGEK